MNSVSDAQEKTRDVRSMRVGCGAARTCDMIFTKLLLLRQMAHRFYSDDSGYNAASACFLLCHPSGRPIARVGTIVVHGGI